MNDRDMLLKQIGTYKFALTDIDMFLDTHPADDKMLALRAQYEKELIPLIEKFEKKYGPLTKDENQTNTWAWVKDPWPWDMEA